VILIETHVFGGAGGAMLRLGVLGGEGRRGPVGERAYDDERQK
jgi:hypothetical protein